jgi:hypothetical protein
MADDVIVRDVNGDSRTMRAVEVSSKLHQTIARSVMNSTSAPSSAAFFLDKASRSDTYTGTASGTTVDVSAQGMKHFGIQVKGTGAAPTSYTVLLEGSLDGTNFSTLLTHTNSSPGDGLILHSGASVLPVLYFRSRCTALVLGSATNIVVTIIGKP